MERGEQLLVESFRGVADRRAVLESLNSVISTHSPISLYIATKDRENCMWIFDPDTTYHMVGGKPTYDRAFNSLFPSEEEKKFGVLMFLLRKVGPILILKLDETMLSNIIRKLIEEP